MALWKARGGSFNKELDFRFWHSGWEGNGSLNKEFDFRSLWKARRGKVYHGIVQRQGGEVQIKT